MSMKTPEQRFLNKVNIPDNPKDCWEWQANKDKGYGKIGINGKSVLAHRFSYLMFNGDPTGLVVRHTCDNPGCVNPSHLMLGTCADNSRDMVERGRSHHGKKSHCKHGHEFNEDNTRIDSKGYRICRACNRRHNTRFYTQERRKALMVDVRNAPYK